MKDKILELFSVKSDTEFEFREIYGFTFVFEKKFIVMGGEMASADIRPIAIIYEENGEYYLAPLDEVSDIEAIIAKYVETLK